MKGQTRAALGIGALTVLLAAVGAGLFVFASTQLGVYFVVGGIPVVLLVVAVAYVRGVLSGEDNTGQYVEQRTKQVGESLRDFWRSLSTIEEAYPRFDASTLRSRADSLVSDYEGQGGQFDRSSGSFSVGKGASSGELQELERIDAEVTTLAADRDDQLYDFVRDELDALHGDMRALADADIAAEPPEPPEAPTPDQGAPSGLAYWDAVGEALDDYRTEADATVDDAIARVRDIQRNATDAYDEAAVDRHLEDAEADRRDGEFGHAVDAVLEAQATLESELSGSFDQDREELDVFVDTILDSGAEQFVDAELFDQVRSVQRELDALDSALDVGSLSEHRQTVRTAALDIVSALEAEADRHVRTLDDADLPAGYYSRPDVVDEDHVDELRAIGPVRDLDREWERAATDLADAVGTVKTKATVVEAYDDVSETIEQELRQHGTVTEDDLPVRHAGQFFGLYFRRNPDVEFDPDAPALHRGDVETYAVDVTVSYDEGSEAKRRATVTLDGGEYDGREVVETHLVGTATFADVPFGEYELVVAPDEDDYGRVERTVHVEGDTDVSVDLEPVTLVEQLVDGRGDEIAEHVTEFAPRLRDRLDEEGYLSTEMAFPITDDFVPGLLAKWADREGYAVTRTDDGTVIVYDDSQLSQEIMNVIQYNLDEGERLSYERIRSNYLSVPVPNTVIEELAAGTGLDVETTADGLLKPAGGEA
ncbi:hypothetical protein [Haloarchaeobius litoreus]|uniref:Coiled-coil protein n=1 Tax=Haloarchaeobius litoreus TaxID=755306 RepID=A0ABD6DHW2_9EURY|nr:hypothetical protein [Haloarchaeobius litoreus]